MLSEEGDDEDDPVCTIMPNFPIYKRLILPEGSKAKNRVKYVGYIVNSDSDNENENWVLLSQYREKDSQCIYSTYWSNESS